MKLEKTMSIQMGQGSLNGTTDKLNTDEPAIIQNEVLYLKSLHRNKKVNQIDIFLPTSVKFYMTDLGDINFIQRRASCNGTIVLQIHYGDLEQNLVDELLIMAHPILVQQNQTSHIVNGSAPVPGSQVGISALKRHMFSSDNVDQPSNNNYNYRGYLTKLDFDNQRPVQLVKSQSVTVEHRKFQKIIQISVNDRFELKMKPSVFWYPITQLKFKLAFQAERAFLDYTITTKESLMQGNLVRFHFNFMYGQEGPILLDEADLGKYKVAESLSRVTFTKHARYHGHAHGREEDSDSDDDQQDNFEENSVAGKYEKPIAFNRAIMRFGLYSISGNYLLRSFFRFKFLGILVMFNYFTSADFSGRMGRLAFITVGLFAIIPSLQASLPVTSSVVLPELFVIAEQINVLLCVIQSYIGRSNDYEKERYKWQTDPWFIIAILLHVVSMVITFGQYLYFRCYTQANFHKPQLAPQQPKIEATRKAEQMTVIDGQILQGRGVAKQWHNHACRTHFHRFINRLYRSYRDFIIMRGDEDDSDQDEVSIQV